MKIWIKKQNKQFYILIACSLILFINRIQSQPIYGITGGAGVGFLTEITIINGQCNVSTVGPLVDIASGLPILFHDLAICPDGTLYAQGMGLLYSIDPSNGLCTPLFPTNVFNINGLTCSPENILYGVSNNPLPHSLIEIDPSSSSSTNLGPLNFWAGGDLVFFNDQLYCVSDDGLFIVNTGNPQSSTFVFHCGFYPALTVLPGYCNSMLASDLDGQFFQINPDTQEENLLCSPGQYMFDFTSLAEFDPATQCPFIIDLDDDNSSGADEYDFNGPVYNCNTSDGIPICDQDVKIMSDIKILSITITLEDGILDGLAEYLKFEGSVPFISVSGSGSQSITLTNTGNASIVSFENALRSILYYNDADPLTPGQRTIKVVGINLLGTTSNDAFAFLEVENLTQLEVDLGPDTTLCQGITYLLDAYYPGATYQWNTGETNSFVFVTEPGLYAVTVSHPDRCPGHDEVEIDFIPSAITSLQLPAVVCSGDSVEIKINSELSDPFDMVLQSTSGQNWILTQIENGHHFKFQANRNQTISVLSIMSEETPCALSELPSYQVRVEAKDTIYNRFNFCAGDSIWHLNQWHYTSDTLQQLLKNKFGCDSLIFSLLHRIDNDTLLTQVFTCNPGEEGITYVSTLSPEGCPIVNAVETLLALSDTLKLFTSTCKLSESGIFETTYTNAVGCDSIVVENKVYQNDLITYVSQTTCIASDTQTVTIPLVSQEGCDSIVVFQNLFKPADTTQLTSFTCYPQEAGTNSIISINQYGCDSIVIETTFLITVDTTRLRHSTCEITMAGTFTSIYPSIYGCDSVVIDEIIYIKADTTQIQQYSCLHTEIGYDTVYLSSFLGCDSVVVIHVDYLAPDTIFASQLSCDSTQAGTFILNNVSQAGCDSITKLSINYYLPDTHFIFKTSCNAEEAGVFENHYTTSIGCDSVVIVRIDKLKTDTTFLENVTCNLQEAGLFTHSLINQWGCDSTVYEDIKWVSADTLKIYEKRCDIAADSLIELFYLNHWGCDSLVQIFWEALPTDFTQIVDTICIQQDTTSIQILLTNSYGCDSIVNIRFVYKRDLTILPEILTCDSIVEDTVFLLLENSVGCDSLVVQPYKRKTAEECKKIYNLILPNIIYPGSSDQGTFHINSGSDLFIQEFSIYDRWGNLMYHKTDEPLHLHQGWNGTFNGIPVVDGVYAYYIQVLWDGYIFKYSGDITVIK